LKSLLRSIPVLVLALCAAASASTVTGTVTNGTTGKPAAGDRVLLIKLAQGMQEAGHTKTDANGHFKLDVPEDGMPHLLRVFHQDVTYHKMVPPGTTSADVAVYDAGKKIAGVGVTADVMRFQAQNSELQGIRLFAVDNQSSPPRTQMGEKNFEFYLPDGAVVDDGMAMTEGGQPLKSMPTLEAQKNRYEFDFPLRPGTTQFQVVFHLPYNGQATIFPKALYPARHFVVMLAKTMQFTPGPGTAFRSMKDPQQPESVVQVASNTKLGQPLSFSISGTGTIADAQQQSNNDQASAQTAGNQADGGAEAAGGTSPDSRPGGGLGPPIDAPGPLQNYWPYILGAFAVLLAGGAVYTMKHPQHAAVLDSGAVATPEARSTARPPSVGRSGLLLDALKEELFELEMEHKQGRISQQEYESARAALDQTLERALKRQAAKAT
jgi:hypothetical protein